jgi:hypothetical protein
VIHIQQDGARPHTSAKFKTLWENLIIGLYLEKVIPSVNKIALRTQPARSPDLNLLNSGLFNALQSQYMKYAPKNASKMLEAVDKVWKAYPHKKINYMWLTIQMNCDEIIKFNRDNSYKLCHMNKVQLERQCILPTIIQVSKEAQQTIEDGVDEDYQLTEEERAEMDKLEDQYGKETGYVSPDAITLEELEALHDNEEEEEGDLVIVMVNENVLG